MLNAPVPYSGSILSPLSICVCRVQGLAVCSPASGRLCTIHREQTVTWQTGTGKYFTPERSSRLLLYYQHQPPVTLTDLEIHLKTG